MCPLSSCRFTSEVSIVPNYMPFPFCGDECQPTDVNINPPWNSVFPH